MNELPVCECCEYKDDIEQIKRNKQFDLIYCTKCEETFERRMKPWHCPFSPLVKKEKQNEDVRGQ